MASPVGYVPPEQEKFGTFLLKPEEGATEVKLVSYNSGNPAYTENASHAERFFLGWFGSINQDTVTELVIKINLSPCSFCTGWLVDGVKSSIPKRELHYSIPYEGHVKSTRRQVPGGILAENTTTTDDRAKLDPGKGWKVEGKMPEWTDETKKAEIAKGNALYRRYKANFPQ